MKQKLTNFGQKTSIFVGRIFNFSKSNKINYIFANTVSNSPTLTYNIKSPTRHNQGKRRLKLTFKYQHKTPNLENRCPKFRHMTHAMGLNQFSGYPTLSQSGVKRKITEDKSRRTFKNQQPTNHKNQTESHPIRLQSTLIPINILNTNTCTLNIYF